MAPNSCDRVFGHANDEKKSADDHEEDNDYKSSATTIGGAILSVHLLMVPVDQSQP
jgi:hypothetical protein